MKQVFWVLVIFSYSFSNEVIAKSVLVRSIDVNGNKKTKTALILRELDFGQGDSLAITDLTDRLQANERLLMNTGLFNQVQINISNWNTE